MDLDKAKDLCAEILERLDDLPQRAERFSEGVREKTEGILSWISEHEHVTDRQSDALENMLRGIKKWLKED